MFLDPDKSFTVFSAQGKLEHCDNALTAALNGALAMGCSAPDGVVIASYKNAPILLVKERYHKVFSVCPSIGVTYAGLQPDFRIQLGIAHSICQDYYDVYNRYPCLDVFIAEFSMTVQEHTQKSGLRPFGTFLIFAGASTSGAPCCYQMDPSGSYRPVETVAAGVDYERANGFIKRRREMLDDNVINIVAALKEHTGKELGPGDISVGVLRDGRFHVYGREEIQEIFDTLGS